uniref:Trihelix transcription factor ASIL1 n=1 Tax=Populus alba TaxID=43335 RepID=A0A4U5QMM4_POPAL|nr:trihelix transcription factor ASIL1 [Populus alba]TKS12054.1 trihelix transcription factor ASIL1 [Populus alba]
MSTPSPSPSPPPPHSPPTNLTPLSSKKTQPLPWTHQETIHLIQAYQEKWYSLKRGQLKASQWEEVAVTVAARCGYDYNHPSKSAVQCRHKMEKLRRRYRDEKRVMALGGTCYWQYFDLMDSLERGPLPISAQPLARVPSQENYHTRNRNNGVLGEYDDDKGEDEDDDDEDYGYRSKLRSRSINYILRKPSIVNRYAGGGPSGVSREAEKKRKREEVEEEEEEEEEEEGEEGVEMGLAGQIKAFSERMVKLERKKLEVMKETERSRMEMENKKLEMILDSHRKIVHMIGEAFGL